MQLKELYAPHLKRTVKMGRRRPASFGRRLFLRKYVSAELPSVPPTCNFTGPAAPVLSNVYLNDQLGDCVIAAGYHIVGVETGNANDLFTATDKEIVSDYSAIGGYVPGDTSTDQGCDEVTALNYWVKHGFADKTKGLGWLAVNPSNRQEVMAAQYLFENLFFAMELPEAWINPMPENSGFTWDVDGPSVPRNGHAVAGVGYNANGVIIDSWGLTGTITWDAIATYCSQVNGGGLYVMLTPDQLHKGQQKAPNGVDWSALIEDFDAMGGTVKPPKPPTPKPPKPKPPKPPAPKPPRPPAPSTGGTGTTDATRSPWVTAPSYHAPLPQPIFDADQSPVPGRGLCHGLGIVAVVGMVATGIVATGIASVVALSERRD